jgi:hypothetical protein
MAWYLAKQKDKFTFMFYQEDADSNRELRALRATECAGFYEKGINGLVRTLWCAYLFACLIEIGHCIPERINIILSLNSDMT